MVINLLDNAIKFSPHKKIILIGTKKSRTHATVWIHDYGPGIAKEELEHIWNRFYKVDKIRNAEEGGSGLGLAITKTLATAQKGSVGVESELGKGSTFYFTLPLWQNNNN